MVRRFFLIIVIATMVFSNAITIRSQEKVMTYEQALACVKANLPAERYMTNEYLPTAESLAKATKPANTTKIRVGSPWILNDELAQLYNAIEKGYFKDEGLEVELISGGPGKDHVQTLGGGAVDIAISAAGNAIPKAVISTTPIDIVAVGTLLKDVAYTLITIRPDLVGKKLTPEDLRPDPVMKDGKQVIGEDGKPLVKKKVIGVQKDGFFYIYMLLDRYGMPRDSVELIEAGFGPDVLLVGKADFYTGWIMNQPRVIEKTLKEQGKDPSAWNAMLYRDFFYSEPSDVIIVRRETLKTAEGQELVRRFLRAVYRGTKYMLDEPEKSAEIAEKYTAMYKDQPVTKAEALSRFEKQKAIVEGTDKLGLLAMNPEQWNSAMANLTMYKELNLSCK